VLLVAVVATTEQVVFEFGPLWLVSLHAPAALYGPYWAALVATVGLGAWIASRIPFERFTVVAALGGALLVAAVLPVAASSLPLVIAAQIVVVLVASVLGVRAGFLMHEAVSSTVRAGVSSGASTLSWIAFLPVSLLFGWLARAQGVRAAGWLIVLIAVALAVLSRAARGEAAGARAADDPVPGLVRSRAVEG
jgi:hypothetical protein